MVPKVLQHYYLRGQGGAIGGGGDEAAFLFGRFAGGRFLSRSAGGGVGNGQPDGSYPGEVGQGLLQGEGCSRLAVFAFRDLSRAGRRLLLPRSAGVAGGGQVLGEEGGWRRRLGIMDDAQIV
jgi:hypothetical protein